MYLKKNRRVVFDNKTKDEGKKVEQVERLLSLVNRVIEQNDGQPYTDEVFAELKVIVFCYLIIKNLSVFYENIVITA
jgi:F0F1-type ATP synthase membrane subunit a